MSEAASLRIGDIDWHAKSVRITGKGKKERRCPLWAKTIEQLRRLAGQRPNEAHLFLNRRGEPFTRYGIHTLVERYVTKLRATAPALQAKRISPHVIRHSTTTHLLQAGVDSHILLTVVLAGDGRLLERLRSDELSPLNSRMRVRLALERATPDELTELLVHALQQAGAVKLMTPELIATLADHAQGNPRALMNIAGELLAVAAQREARHIDEKLFLEMCATPPLPEPKTARPRR